MLVFFKGMDYWWWTKSGNDQRHRETSTFLSVLQSISLPIKVTWSAYWMKLWFWSILQGLQC